MTKITTIFRLLKGKYEVAPNLDGWIITSDVATTERNEDILLLHGDKITIDGDIIRNGDIIANIS